MEGTQRKLAAIVMADVVGYSRLMGADEFATLEAMRAHRQDLWDPTIDRYGGRVVNRAGDSALIEFTSAVAAIECSVAIQTGMVERNAGVSDDRRVELRIGVNIGEVIVDGEEIYGDGVNIAARLQTLAEPGGIALSGNVEEQTRTKLDLDLSDDGEHTVKNINRPIHVFQWTPAPDQRPKSHKQGKSRKTSIAVLPFDNFTADSEKSFVADGISEDLITALSKFKTFHVIARSSTFAYKDKGFDAEQVARNLGADYVVQGSVRFGGERVRITGHLIQTDNASQIWSERYDRVADDLFDLQDEIVTAIIQAIEPEINQLQRIRAMNTPPASLDAWGLYHQGLTKFYASAPDSLNAAVELFDQSYRLDPGFACGLAMAAATRTHQVLFEKPEDRAGILEKAKEQTREAMQLDPREPVCLYAQGRLNSFLGHHEEAIESFRKAIDLNPNFSLAHYGLGYAYVVSGRSEQAVEQYSFIQTLSPHDAMSTGTLTMLAIACFDLKRYDDAISYGLKAANQPDPRIWGLCFLATSLREVGRTDEAERYLARVYEMQPKFSLSFVRKAGAHWNERIAQHRLAMLAAAGVPENERP